MLFVLAYDDSTHTIVIPKPEYKSLIVLSCDTGVCLYDLDINNSTRDKIKSGVCLRNSLMLPYNVNGNVEHVLMMNDYDSDNARVLLLDYDNKCVNYHELFHHGIKKCFRNIYDRRQNKLFFFTMTSDKGIDHQWCEWKFIH